MERAVIELRDVTLRYGRARTEDDRPALSCRALTIDSGLTLLLGPNGAGKSTLLKIAAGIERPLTGTIAIDGHDMWRDEVEARSALAYVPEHPDLTPYATVREIMALVCELRGEPIEHAAIALDRVGLNDLAHRSVRELSMGQRRRAVLASAFIGAPRTVLLDEPLETMDRGVRDVMLAWVAALVELRVTLVIATHEIEPFVALATRAICVSDGTTTLIDTLPSDHATRLADLERYARGML